MKYITKLEYNKYVHYEAIQAKILFSFHNIVCLSKQQPTSTLHSALSLPCKKANYIYCYVYHSITISFLNRQCKRHAMEEKQFFLKV